MIMSMKRRKFIDVYQYIVDDLIERAKEYKVINYLVPGVLW